ncbi:MAG: hypothetical protein ACQEVA_17615 [Myxococcota bacterium]
MGTEATRARGVLSLALLALLTFVALPAWAQSDGETREPAEISDRQIELNEEGVRAIIDGDHQKAVAVLSESLAYGEANATYLNLGRAYQKLGDCEEAREALQNALTAPAVDDPPPRVIDKKAEQYLGELEEECPKEQPAEEPQQEEKAEAESAETDAKVQDPEQTAEKDPQDVKDPGPAPSQDEVDSGGNGLAWASIGVGAAFVGGGVAMHMLASQERAPVYEAGGGDPNVTVVEFNDIEAQEREDRANLYDTIGLSADIAGGALIGVGVVMLLTDSDRSDASSFLIAPTRDGAAASYRLEF